MIDLSDCDDRAFHDSYPVRIEKTVPDEVC